MLNEDQNEILSSKEEHNQSILIIVSFISLCWILDISSDDVTTHLIPNVYLMEVGVMSSFDIDEKCCLPCFSFYSLTLKQIEMPEYLKGMWSY